MKLWSKLFGNDEEQEQTDRVNLLMVSMQVKKESEMIVNIIEIIEKLEKRIERLERRKNELRM